MATRKTRSRPGTGHGSGPGSRSRSGTETHGTQEPYHHGDLRAALIRAADEILAEQGVEGFSLRKAARRAGVSAAAPAHHFSSSAGLLTEVAILGFDALAGHLQVPDAATPVQRLHRQGAGYVRFANAHRGCFQLMFRRDLLLPDHADLQQAGDRCMRLLEDTVRDIHAIPDGRPLDAAARAELLAAWSMVHGFAHLMLDGKLSHLHAGAGNEHLLADMLPAMMRGQWPEPA